MRNSRQFLKDKINSVLEATGRKARDFDDAYAAAVRDLLMTDRDHPSRVVQNMGAYVVGTPLGHGLPEVVGIDPKTQRGAYLREKALSYAIPAVSAGVRYGIPAATGVLAGKELLDVIAAEGTDDTTLQLVQ